MSDEQDRFMAARRSRNLWVLSGVFGLGFIALFVIAVLTPLGQLIDAGSLSLFGWLRSDAWLAVYDGRDIVMYCVLAGAAVAALSEVLQHQWGPPAYSVLLLALVGAVSIGMKEFVVRPDLGDFAYAHNTFPSGHTAMVLSGAVAIIWCGQRWMSPVLVLVLGGLVTFVALSSVFSMAHRASDTIGGALLAGAVSCGLAAVSRATERVTTRRRKGTVIAGAVMVGVGLVYLAGALGLFGGGEHGLQLAIAILLCTLGLTVAILAVHRPFLVQASKTQLRLETTGEHERL